MKDISIYLTPLTYTESQNILKIGGSIHQYTEDRFPEIEKGGVALCYVPEFRGDANNPSNKRYPESFRTYFYELFLGQDWNIPLYDLGNILPGKELKDTYFAVSQVVSELVRINVTPVIIGGGQDLTIAMYNGYERLEQMVNLCSVDSKLDLGDPEEAIHSDGYISHLLLQRPCYLFNHANVGLQAPFASKAAFELFDKLYFDTCRLGEFNADFKKAEPHLRNSDILSLDMKSIRSSELGSMLYDSPNGFFADQICQIAKYAGISDKLTSLGIFNYYAEKTPGTTSHLLAQIVWYFIDGLTQRKGDFPVGSKKDYFKFTVHLEDINEDLVFFKSHKSDRWWMEVPYPPHKGAKYERHQLVPCDQEDYQLAMKGEIPNLWWKTYQKFV